MSNHGYLRHQFFLAYDDGCRRCENDLRHFKGALDVWLDELLLLPLQPNWREQLTEFLVEQEARGYRVENPWVLEEEILYNATERGLVDSSQLAIESEPGFIPLPEDYPTPEQISAADAWERLQRELLQDLSEERTDQVFALREALADRLRRRLLAEARSARRLSMADSFLDGFVAGLMALRAAATRSEEHIAARDEAFHELGIDRSGAANATKFAAAVAVTAAEAAALLVAGGAVLGPVARALAAYYPTGVAVAETAALASGALLAGAKLAAAQEAFAAGRTQEGIDLSAEALVLAVLVAAGALHHRPASAAAQSARGWTIQRRLQEFYRRLGAQTPSSNAEDALRRVNDTLDEVENLYSGIPKKVPSPPPSMPDGRMYPPQMDNIKRHVDGSMTAGTRRHTITLGNDGSIAIGNRSTGQIEFHQPGLGGRNGN